LTAIYANLTLSRIYPSQRVKVQSNIVWYTLAELLLRQVCDPAGGPGSQTPIPDSMAIGYAAKDGKEVGEKHRYA